MNTKRFVFAVVGVFVFVFLYEWLFHGYFLMDLYRQTAQLWRPEGEAKMFYMILGQLFFSLMIAFIFTLKYENRGIFEGVRFGLYFGLLLGLPQIASFAYMEIPFALAFGWMAAEFLKGLGSGIALSLIYKK